MYTGLIKALFMETAAFAAGKSSYDSTTQQCSAVKQKQWDRGAKSCFQLQGWVIILCGFTITWHPFTLETFGLTFISKNDECSFNSLAEATFSNTLLLFRTEVRVLWLKNDIRRPALLNWNHQLPKLSHYTRQVRVGRSEYENAPMRNLWCSYLR